MKIVSLSQIQGRVDIQGTPAELYKSNDDFVELVGIKEMPDVKESAEAYSRQQSETISSRSSSSSSLNSAKESIKPTEKDRDQGVQMEASSKGTVKGPILVNYFKAGAHWSILLTLLLSFLVVQFLASATDYWVSIW